MHAQTRQLVGQLGDGAGTFGAVVRGAARATAEAAIGARTIGQRRGTLGAFHR
ncbi:hypothetical protein [Micromonospora sp. IBHARD004]|uniref:hypothetical protein n=1 Tax=Micromonospora sp. IBHARD004 TaxID=3457764 RepID=UPI0040588602